MESKMPAPKKFRPYEETHQKGYIEVVVEGKYMVSMAGDLGVKIAKDGRVWICVDGVSFLRFKPIIEE